jgi:hypothetical protein
MPSLKAWPKEKHIKAFPSRKRLAILLVVKGIDAFQKQKRKMKIRLRIKLEKSDLKIANKLCTIAKKLHLAVVEKKKIQKEKTIQKLLQSEAITPYISAIAHGGKLNRY